MIKNISVYILAISFPTKAQYIADVVAMPFWIYLMYPIFSQTYDLTIDDTPFEWYTIFRYDCKQNALEGIPYICENTHGCVNICMYTYTYTYCNSIAM